MNALQGALQQGIQQGIQQAPLSCLALSCFAGALHRVCCTGAHTTVGSCGFLALEGVSQWNEMLRTSNVNGEKSGP